MKKVFLFTALLSITAVSILAFTVTYQKLEHTEKNLAIMTGNYNRVKEELLNSNKSLVSKEIDLEIKEAEIISLKQNAARVASLSPIADLVSEDELKNLLKEIPTGTPFPGGLVPMAPYGVSVGFHGLYRSDHKGIDGAPADGIWDIYPYAPGVVEQFGYDRVYGKFIYVRHSENVRSFYAHAAKIFYRATTGNEVEEDTVMMIMGETGQADGPHLHFEIQVQTMRGWIAIDPTPFLEEGYVRF